MRFNAVLGVALLSLVACSSAVHQGRLDRDLITHDQMVAGHFQTAYDAVTSLHSNWLVIRPNTLGPGGAQPDVMIYHDAVRLNGPNDLKNIPYTTIDHIRYYDPPAATMRWGVGHSQGAIQVSTVP